MDSQQKLTPRRSNSQKSENLEEWNTQSGGIARGMELPVELPPALHKEPEPEGSHWFRLLMKEPPGGRAGSSQSGMELPGGRGVELPGGGTRKNGTPRGQGGGTPRGNKNYATLYEALYEMFFFCSQTPVLVSLCA